MNTPPHNQPGHVGPGATSRPEARGDGSRFKDDAEKLAEQAATQGKTRVEDARGTAADKLDTLADSVQAAATELGQDDVGHLSEYISELADSMSKLSGSLRDKSGDEIVREIGQLAREHPAVFITGSIAIGLGLARFARASQRHDTTSSDARDSSATSSSRNGSSPNNDAETPPRFGNTGSVASPDNQGGMH